MIIAQVSGYTFLYYGMAIIGVAILAFIGYQCLMFLIQKWLSKQQVDKAAPILKALTILLAGYKTIDSTGEKLIDLFIDLVSKAASLPPKPETSITDFLTDTIFMLGVTAIALFYIYRAYRNDVFAKTSKEPLPETKINFPKSPKPPSPFLQERIKHLLELKHEQQNLSLKYDPKLQILYGHYKQGIHTFAYVIYCDETTTQLTKDNIEAKYQELKKAVKKWNLVPYRKPKLILDYYYVLAKGKVPLAEYENMFCQNEATFLHHLIDFDNYLRKRIHDFTQKKLHSGRITKEEDKLTLADTFISSHFCIDTNTESSTKKLAKYVDTWTQQDSQKHLVVLGDYGMGKTSFLRYYAHRLAQKILVGDTTQRFPVFISLTNTSLRHGGMNKAIGAFIAQELGVNQALFEALVNQGKVLFLLDGFDEMGFIGTHEQRVKQFNAIWQLATKNNKILLSGRPSYFPIDIELQQTLNIKEDDTITYENPYFERLVLQSFEREQIKTSIEKYNYTFQEQAQYLAFIENNQSIYELCTRPSMMHIVRDMLPSLLKETNSQMLNAGQLMQKYIDVWIDRQFGKAIEGSIEDKTTKKQLILDFFRDLAAMYYEKGIEKMPATDFKSLFQKHLQGLNLDNQDEIDGLEQELLAGFLIEIEQDEYRFVHKPFREYLVADKIVHFIDKQATKEHLFYKKWTNEITDFVYDRLPETKWFGIPSLLQVTTKYEWNAKLKFFLFRYTGLFLLLLTSMFLWLVFTTCKSIEFQEKQAMQTVENYVDSLTKVKQKANLLISKDQFYIFYNKYTNQKDTFFRIKRIDNFSSLMHFNKLYYQKEKVLYLLTDSLFEIEKVHSNNVLDIFKNRNKIYKLSNYSSFTPNQLTSLLDKSCELKDLYDSGRKIYELYELEKLHKKLEKLCELYSLNKLCNSSYPSNETRKKLYELENLYELRKKIENIKKTKQQYDLKQFILVSLLIVIVLILFMIHIKIHLFNNYKFIAKAYYIALRKGEADIPKTWWLLELLSNNYGYDCSEFRKKKKAI